MTLVLAMEYIESFSGHSVEALRAKVLLKNNKQTPSYHVLMKNIERTLFGIAFIVACESYTYLVAYLYCGAVVVNVGMRLYYVH